MQDLSKYAFIYYDSPKQNDLDVCIIDVGQNKKLFVCIFRFFFGFDVCLLLENHIININIILIRMIKKIMEFELMMIASAIGFFDSSTSSLLAVGADVA